LPQTPVNLGDSSDENPLVLTRKVERQVHHKTLRRKSIEKWLDKELED
jgi:predicted GTPase